MAVNTYSTRESAAPMFTYDAIGNPLQYRDGMSFTWAKGRQLQSVAKDGLTASYTYDENGLRISKTVNGVTTKIYRTNGQAVGMNSSDGKDMTFLLDGDGKVYGVHYDHYSFDQKKTETYYFAFNAQGDVIGIYEFYGKVIATYDYDEWGNCTVNVLCEDNNGHAVDSPDHIAYANPFRYRGYFYDAETGFYYLNSRYYDPATGRFLNVDKVVSGSGESVHGYNMFAYGFNNPVNTIDEDGNWPQWVKTVAKVAAAVAVVVAVTAVVAITAGAAAAVLGASAAVISGVVTGAMVGGIVAGAVNIGVQCKTKGARNLSVRDTAKSTFYGSAAGALSGAASGFAPACNTATQIVIQKGFQIAANTLISDSAYLMQSISSGGPTLYGMAISTFSGVVSGATFNASTGNAFAISVGLELSGYGEELINMFLEKTTA